VVILLLLYLICLKVLINMFIIIITLFLAEIVRVICGFNSFLLKARLPKHPDFSGWSAGPICCDWSTA